jgi:REP element-mobilizing transposase RayT
MKKKRKHDGSESGRDAKRHSKRHWEMMSTVWAGAGGQRKRGLRILPKEGGFFVHVTSRTAGQGFLFGDQEKRVFVSMMRKWAGFSGLGILTYCLMDNHFHILLWVPPGVKMAHGEILGRLEGVWPEEKTAAWEAFYQKQHAATRERMDAAVRERMANLPEFMRVLKQSFAGWYNRSHGRRGTLWDSRYRSVVVEENPLALMSVAAYIDLNPLRAGMVEDPMGYAWSGYGAAMGGDKPSREGLDALVRLSRGHLPQAALRVRLKQVQSGNPDWREIAPGMEKERRQRAAPADWGEVQACYRIWLVNKGESKVGIPEATSKSRNRRGLDPVRVVAEYEKRGQVPVTAGLQSRKRAFTRGVAVGGAGFLEKLMREYRSCFGPGRKSAARRVKGLGSAWMSLRQVD